VRAGVTARAAPNEAGRQQALEMERLCR